MLVVVVVVDLDLRHGLLTLSTELQCFSSNTAVTMKHYFYITSMPDLYYLALSPPLFDGQLITKGGIDCTRRFSLSLPVTLTECLPAWLCVTHAMASDK
ncbi:MAG: hypothetical protein QWI73_06660 [Alphaproteobacteria bacterium]|nr:hypothetical protein [Alphaproteobacteria bacterium]